MSRLNPDGRNEPRFDIDVVRGRQGELQIHEYLEWIAAGNGAAEVKTKSYPDLNFYVETAHDPGRRGEFTPSGISVTTAHVWAYCFEGTGLAVFFPTTLLREMLDHPTTRDKVTERGTCPTRGKLVNLGALICRLKQQQQRGQVQ